MRGAESARAKIILYKCALYGIALYFIGVLQVTFFAGINVFGATPDLLLAAVATVALYEDIKVAGICGIISGFFYTALGGFSIPLYIIFSFLCAYALSVATENGLPKKHSSFLIVAILAFGAKALFNIAEISLSASSFSAFGTVKSIIIPEFLSSMLLCPVAYLIFFGISRIFNKKQAKKG